ncbi:hypothetical protein [Anaerovorax odorimutans]|uniref:hypothetical protein n=1 Tax=Anaerovorax odorimutans TaxID=109327 RepID=UPI000415B113|nr:hypothetical protein [Anaerovorax odorimutans]
MLLEKGFIKVWRSLIKWEWYSDINTTRLFIHLLLTVNYETSKWQGNVIKRGERITTIANLSQETGLTQKQIRGSLDKLKKTGEITSKGTNKFTLITVENYSRYQDVYEQDGEQKANKSKRKGQQGFNQRQQIKKEKEIKKDREEMYNNLDKRLRKPLNDFIEMREDIKKPLNDRAIQMILDKLHTLSNGDINTSVKILQQSTINCWQGIFPIKEESKKEKDGQADNDKGLIYDYNKFFD